MNKHRLHILLRSPNKFLLLFFFLFTLSTFAATRTWDGSEGSNWNTKGNWVGNKVPSSKDNVIIPLVSTNYPVIDDNFAVKNITINAGGSLTINSGGLDISKKMENSGSFIQNEGTVSAQNLDITSTGTFSLAGGDLTVSKSLKIDEGTFSQAGGTVTTKKLEIINGGDYNQSNGEINISGEFNVTTGNTFDSIGGIVHFTGNAGNATDYQGNIQFHDIIIDSNAKPKFDNDNNVNIGISGNYENNNSGLRVTKATFTFNGSGIQSIESASSFGNSTFGNLVINKPSGSTTMLSDLGVEDTFEELSGVLELNGFILTVAGIPVPVELTSFTAKIFKNGIMLNWSTATEVNNYGFEIERASTSISTTFNTSSRAESRVWVKIGFVDGHGNSNSPKDYTFYDKSPLKGIALYRLKQIDTDGAFEYSNEVEMSFSQSGKAELYQNHPNPFNPSTVISFNLPELSQVSITIYNAIGQKVKELVNQQMDAGYHNVNFDASNLSTGFYFYRLETANYAKTMKMILLR